jgi:hypothetical protein
MNFVNHDSTRKLVGKFLGSEGMELWRVYLMQAEEEETRLLRDEMKAKWLDFLKTRSVFRIWILENGN